MDTGKNRSQTTVHAGDVAGPVGCPPMTVEAKERFAPPVLEERAILKTDGVNLRVCLTREPWTVVHFFESVRSYFQLAADRIDGVVTCAGCALEEDVSDGTFGAFCSGGCERFFCLRCSGDWTIPECPRCDPLTAGDFADEPARPTTTQARLEVFS